MNVYGKVKMEAILMFCNDKLVLAVAKKLIYHIKFLHISVKYRFLRVSILEVEIDLKFL